MAVAPLVPLVTCSGLPRTVGQQHGETLRTPIEDFLCVLEENVYTRAAMKVTVSDLQTVAEKNLAYSREYDPDLSEEIQGIADGAAQPVWRIGLLNSFLDIVNLRDRRSALSVLGCTTWAAGSSATADGSTFVGQNYEMEAFYKKFRILLRLKPVKGAEVLAYSYAGVVGCAGLNSAGIGVAINFLHPRGAGAGTIYPFVVRKILAQQTIGDAVGAATIGRRAGGANYLIAGDNGLIFDVETAPTDHDILVADQGVLAHANHYVSPTLRHLDLLLWDTTYNSSIERRGSSLVRHYIANMRLRGQIGAITQDSLFDLCADHTNHPFSICCHGRAEDADLVRGVTNASLLFDLSRRWLWLHPGSPCETTPERYELE